MSNRRRLGEHILEIIDYLKSLGFDDVDVKDGKHIKLSWMFKDRKRMVTCSKTPTNRNFIVFKIKQDIHRILKTAT